jgi:hypothetical protein
MQFEPSTLDLQRKAETEAQLASQNKLAREAPMKKYMEAYLNGIVKSTLKKQGREHLISLGIGGSLVMSLMGTYRIAIGELLPTGHHEEYPSRLEYPEAFKFIDAAGRLINGVKTEQVQNKLVQERGEALINYGPILAQLKEEFGEPVAV